MNGVCQLSHELGPVVVVVVRASVHHIAPVTVVVLACLEKFGDLLAFGGVEGYRHGCDDESCVNSVAGVENAEAEAGI